MSEQKKVLVIGASGMVGMATVEALRSHLPVDIITYDRAPDEAGLKARSERTANFNKLKQHDLLDKQQAEWITCQMPQLAHEQQGSVSNAGELAEALSARPDCIVIASGIPRKAGRSSNEKFSPLVPLNAPYFRELGETIADAYVTSLKKHSGAAFPIIINTGNPVDTMAELLVKTISSRLASHMREALKANDTELAARLGKDIKEIPKKVMGQGGVIDSSRAAFSLQSELGIPLNQIAELPVLGPHNAHMVVGFEGIKIHKDGHIVSLEEYLGRPVTDAEKDAINKHTRDGAATVLADTQTKTGLAQTALFGTAASVTQMVQAALGDKEVKLCASVYDPILDRSVGRPIKLNHNGATLSGRGLDDVTHQQLQKGIAALTVAFEAAQEACGLQATREK